MTDYWLSHDHHEISQGCDNPPNEEAESERVCVFLQTSEQLDTVDTAEGLSILLQLRILQSIYFYF